MNNHDGVAEHNLFDPGLQPERTLLAWRRTCLSFGLAALIGMRFTAEFLGALSVLMGLAGAGIATFAYILAATGYRQAHHSLRHRNGLDRAGLPMFLATVAVLTIGALCAASLVYGFIGSPRFV